MNIGKIIKFHRDMAGLSREKLADLAGTGKTVIYDIEHGKTTVRYEIILRIMKVLNISVNFQSPLMHLMEEKNG